MGAGVLNPPFPRRNRSLHAGNLPLEDIAARFGTPLYVYDAAVIRERYERLSSAFAAADPLIAYSVKANGTLGVLRLLASLGAGADIVSGGELYRAQRAGVPPEKIVFAGVGKTDEEILWALEAGILLFNVESDGELDRIEALARASGRTAPVAVRVNPDVHSTAPHEYIRTGHADTKFGVSLDRTVALYRRIHASDALRARGIDVHIGSQISSPRPHLEALAQSLSIVRALEAEGIPLEYLDLGGGFGVSYESQEEMPVADLADAVVDALEGCELKLILEPGRFLVADAGVLITRVLGIKQGLRKRFVITDGGMTDLLRPSLYEGYHAIEPVVDREGVEMATVDVVGPVCESGDFFAKGRSLPVTEVGDLLAIRTVGAYGFAMASNYNARCRPAEVMVDGDEALLVRERETFEDLIRGEHMPSW